MLVLYQLSMRHSHFDVHGESNILMHYSVVSPSSLAHAQHALFPVRPVQGVLKHGYPEGMVQFVSANLNQNLNNKFQATK